MPLIGLQPFVHGIFGSPSHLADLNQAHHATTALQGVIAATDRHQGIVIFAPGQTGFQTFPHDAQYFGRFFEENLQQLLIFCGTRLHHFRCSLHRRWRRCRLAQLLQFSRSHGQTIDLIGVPIRNLLQITFQLAKGTG